MSHVPSMATVSLPEGIPCISHVSSDYHEYLQDLTNFGA